VVYISHRIKEIFEVADRVTVLKDGKVVGTETITDVDEKTLVRMMIGRTLDIIFPAKGKGGTEIILSAHNLTRTGAFDDITFDLYKGEILGLAGLVGAGRTEVVRAIFGADPVESGEISFNGRTVRNWASVSSIRSSTSSRTWISPKTSSWPESRSRA
jgi:ABC-type sugar transport system ATPase subunit